MHLCTGYLDGWNFQHKSKYMALGNAVMEHWWISLELRLSLEPYLQACAVV